MTCYYCIHNTGERCERGIEGYPLPEDAECKHFWFDTGEDVEDPFVMKYCDYAEIECRNDYDCVNCDFYLNYLLPREAEVA